MRSCVRWTFSRKRGRLGGALAMYVLNNSATSSTLVPGNLLIDNYRFHDNISTSHGGAIDNGTTRGWTIRNSSFCNNQSANQGGDIHFVASPFNVIENCTFTEARSTGHGGSLYFESATCDISNSSFVDNRTTSASSDGGAIYLVGSSVNLNRNNFYNNEAFDGGAVHSLTWYTGSVRSTATECNFYGNRTRNTAAGTTDGGAALCVAHPSNGWDIDNCKFVSNTVASSSRGGAISNYGANTSLTNSLFYDNRIGASTSTAGADISNYNSTGGYYIMSGNRMQLSSAASYINFTGATPASSYAFTDYTFSNTDDGTIALSIPIACGITSL